MPYLQVGEMPTSRPHGIYRHHRENDQVQIHVIYTSDL